jgi:hypothetical protein
MSKLNHFQDQLAETNNPDPILYYMIATEADASDYEGTGLAPVEGAMKYQILRTRKNQLTEDLVGMRFASMKGKYPLFVDELVEA